VNNEKKRFQQSRFVFYLKNKVFSRAKNFTLKNCKQRKMLYLLSGIFSVTKGTVFLFPGTRVQNPLVIFYPDTGYQQAQKISNGFLVPIRLFKSVVKGR
jgi:hypothetical protein